ncbi:winged helix-turn-helix domain-containing protein, partial [Streptomyces sp. NPDC048663]|uniref:winged helix-turn-helix domain-containing protein n=1 Tax=Streptomyces sp. NPDC048663 TaxID=3155638 RepID=UPI0034198632
MDAGAGEDPDRSPLPCLAHRGGTWQLLKRHAWSWQQPARRAIERDDVNPFAAWRRSMRPVPRWGWLGSHVRSRSGS